jgi:NAD(P)-dependent dehydrogenase (short-subunit alcohol dehydrogenase family)
MCRFYAVTFANRGITVNAVCAGITDDSIVNALPKEAQDALLSWLRDGWNPMGRAGTPADIGGAQAHVEVVARLLHRHHLADEHDR